jgi:hypothetical protein
LPKFEFEKIVNKEQKLVFDAFTDFNQLSKIAPDFFISIRIRSSRDNVSVIEENLKIDNNFFAMMTKHVVDYPHSHKIFVIGGDSKGTSISESFLHDAGVTKVSIVIDFKLSGKQKFLNLVKPLNVERNFSKMYDEIISSLNS